MDETRRLIEELNDKLDANSLGLQNVYNEFEKYKLSTIIKNINEVNERLDHYEREKYVDDYMAIDFNEEKDAIKDISKTIEDIKQFEYPWAI